MTCHQNSGEVTHFPPYLCKYSRIGHPARSNTKSLAFRNEQSSKSSLRNLILIAIFVLKIIRVLRYNPMFNG